MHSGGGRHFASQDFYTFLRHFWPAREGELNFTNFRCQTELAGQRRNDWPLREGLATHAVAVNCRRSAYAHPLACYSQGGMLQSPDVDHAGSGVSRGCPTLGYIVMGETTFRGVGFGSIYSMSA